MSCQSCLYLGYCIGRLPSSLLKIDGPMALALLLLSYLAILSHDTRGGLQGGRMAVNQVGPLHSEFLIARIVLLDEATGSSRTNRCPRVDQIWG